MNSLSSEDCINIDWLVIKIRIKDRYELNFHYIQSDSISSDCNQSYKVWNSEELDSRVIETIGTIVEYELNH